MHQFGSTVRTKISQIKTMRGEAASQQCVREMWARNVATETIAHQQRAAYNACHCLVQEYIFSTPRADTAFSDNAAYATPAFVIIGQL